MKCVGLAVVFLVWLVAPARADFQAGMAAYERGDYAVAFREFKPLAESGHIEAQLYLGRMYYGGDGVSQDLAEAANWALKSAEQGNDNAQFLLGLMYLSGHGVQRNPGAAANWFRKVAEHYSKIGWAHTAQLILGELYENGEGVPQDYREALKWYEAAARPKVPDSAKMPGFGYSDVGSGAQLKIGTMYYQSKGVPQDYREAAKWFRLSAERGDSDAQAYLGHMYKRGEGLPQDYALAAKWLLMGAKQGSAQAQYDLGAIYLLGRGVPQDYVLAHMWFNLAAAGGHATPAKARDLLARAMTSAQIEEAQRLAREWNTGHVPISVEIRGAGIAG